MYSVDVFNVTSRFMKHRYLDYIYYKFGCSKIKIKLGIEIFVMLDYRMSVNSLVIPNYEIPATEAPEIVSKGVDLETKQNNSVIQTGAKEAKSYICVS